MAVANKPEDDSALQRKLWLAIARHLVQSACSSDQDDTAVRVPALGVVELLCMSPGLKQHRCPEEWVSVVCVCSCSQDEVCHADSRGVNNGLHSIRLPAEPHTGGAAVHAADQICLSLASPRDRFVRHPSIMSHGKVSAIARSAQLIMCTSLMDPDAAGHLHFSWAPSDEWSCTSERQVSVVRSACRSPGCLGQRPMHSSKPDIIVTTTTQTQPLTLPLKRHRLRR